MPSDYRKTAAKWYKSALWQRLRAAQLTKYPYCQCPHHKGKDKSAVAAVVDHIEPHRGNHTLFSNKNNLQSMTKQCHDKFKQSQERGGSGFMAGCDAHGNPLHTDHSWWN